MHERNVTSQEQRRVQHEQQQHCPSVIGIDFFNQVLTGETTMTLRADKNDSDHIPCVLVLNDQGGSVMHISYDVTSTLRAETKHHEPIVMVYDSRGNGDGAICHTITGDHQDRITDYTALIVQRITPKDSESMNRESERSELPVEM